VSKTLLLSLSLFLMVFGVNAQLKDADDFFHSGAQFYVHGKKEESKNEILTGLKFYPNDPKLNGMAVLLKKEEQQQQQQNQQSKDDQQKQDQQKQQDQQQKQPDQSQQKQDASKQDQQKQQQQEQQQQSQAGKADEPKPKEQPAGKPSEDQKEPSEEEKQEAAAAAAGEMTPKQAAQLLDAQKGNEQMMPSKPHKPSERTKPVKDW